MWGKKSWIFYDLSGKKSGLCTANSGHIFGWYFHSYFGHVQSLDPVAILMIWSITHAAEEYLATWINGSLMFFISVRCSHVYDIILYIYIEASWPVERGWNQAVATSWCLHGRTRDGDWSTPYDSGISSIQKPAMTLGNRLGTRVLIHPTVVDNWNQRKKSDSVEAPPSIVASP